MTDASRGHPGALIDCEPVIEDSEELPEADVFLHGDINIERGVETGVVTTETCGISGNPTIHAQVGVESVDGENRFKGAVIEDGVGIVFGVLIHAYKVVGGRCKLLIVSIAFSEAAILPRVWVGIIYFVLCVIGRMIAKFDLGRLGTERQPAKRNPPRRCQHCICVDLKGPDRSQEWRTDVGHREYVGESHG